MNTRAIIIAGIIFSLIAEGSLISFPLAVALCILLYLLYPEVSTLLIIFLASVVLDALSLNQIGVTTLYLLISCTIIYLYKNTFELKDSNLIVLILFIFTFLYGVLFGYGVNLLFYIILFALVEGLVYYFSRKAPSRTYA